MINSRMITGANEVSKMPPEANGSSHPARSAAITIRDKAAVVRKALVMLRPMVLWNRKFHRPVKTGVVNKAAVLKITLRNMKTIAVASRINSPTGAHLAKLSEI